MIPIVLFFLVDLPFSLVEPEITSVRRVVYESLQLGCTASYSLSITIARFDTQSAIPLAGTTY
jgi:hypothetical protein